MVSEKKLLAQFLLPFERYFCKKIIVTIIPTKLGGSFKLFFPFPLRITKSKNDVSENWWSNNKKYFCVLFIAKTTLFQWQAEFNWFLKRNSLTCYSCQYYSFMIERCCVEFYLDAEFYLLTYNYVNKYMYMLIKVKPYYEM